MTFHKGDTIVLSDAAQPYHLKGLRLEVLEVFRTRAKVRVVGDLRPSAMVQLETLERWGRPA